MNKSRNWTFILYPESADNNWKEILQETGLPIAISPLHDKDINPTGEVKKEHYHVMLLFDGPTTYNNVLKITELVKGTIPKRVLSVVGMYRYFTHTDNPEKYKYSSDDILCFNGFDIKDVNPITATQKIAIKKELQRIIIAKNILEYSQFMDFLLDYENSDYYEIASTHTLFFDRYISSRRNKLKDTLQELNELL